MNPARRGTKAAALYRLVVPAGGEVKLRLRLTATKEAAAQPSPFADFDAVFAARRAEADAFYAATTGPLSPDERLAVRQAYAGLLWSKQFYHYVVRAWLEGDPAHPPPPAGRARRAQRRLGRTSTTATSSRCPTSGSTRGSRPGISRST